jgi:glycosyltransferase involved in cell wall biosynthesis
MRIAILSHVRQPIAEPFAGGMEAHSWHLAAGLEARGHEVTLFASGDSDPRFAIDPVLSEHYERTFPWAEHKGLPALIEHVDRGYGGACERLTRERFDVVHNNSLHRFPLQHAREGRMPTVTSLHVPPFPAIEWFVTNSPAPWHKITVTSERQLWVWFKGAPSPDVSVVHNGIDLERWRFSAERGTAAIWCGRIAANKGPHFAAEAARLAGVPLDLYGVVEERDYFEQKLVPLLDHSIRYHGHARGEELGDALRRAAVLVFTPCWDEPFGLVAVEAMACGLPIAAFDNGAAREVIGEQVGRFAPSEDVAALAQAIREAWSIDRTHPRQRATSLYSNDRMLQRYENLYSSAIDAA